MQRFFSIFFHRVGSVHSGAGERQKAFSTPIQAMGLKNWAIFNARHLFRYKIQTNISFEKKKMILISPFFNSNRHQINFIFVEKINMTPMVNL